MAIESDPSIALPVPPPARPAARQAAIDAALRKFDGLEEPSATPSAGKQPAASGWASAHRRPVAALATAVLVAMVSVPVALIALRDTPSAEAPPAPAPIVEQSSPEVADIAATEQAPQAQANTEVSAEPPSLPTMSEPAPRQRRNELALVPSERSEAPAVTGFIATAPAAPPPPPPPPPPAAESVASAAEADQLVVTGSRIAQPNLSKQDAPSRAERKAVQTSPLSVIAPGDTVLSQLQASLSQGNRRAVIRLIGFPLEVDFGDRTQTYRSRREVERDFDRIFTPSLKNAVHSESGIERAGAIAKGRIRLGTSDGQVRITRITP